MRRLVRKGKDTMGNRIEGESAPVGYAAIQNFFEERSSRADVRSKYNYVLFQDDHPELAEKRDAMEKERIGAILAPHIHKGMCVLDLGCGIGRWGEYFLTKGIRYVGMDGSAGMVERGAENLAGFTGKKLFQGYVQDFPRRLVEVGEKGEFDILLVNGVFMYLNDADFVKALHDLRDYVAPSALIYLKESMGETERLTLQQVESAELKQEYSAIYRSIAEYRKAFEETFSAPCYKRLSDGSLFASGRNRKETLDYYFVYQRI